MKKYLIAGGIVGAVLLLLAFRGGVTGTPLDFGCLNNAWVNTSSTVNTTATQVLSAASMGCPVTLSSNNGNTTYCWLEKQTAASSSVQINSGIRFFGTTSTIGVTEHSFGPNEEFDGRGYNLNCISTPLAGVLTILRK